MNTQLTEFAYDYLSELFEPQGESSPEEIGAVQIWLMRNIGKKEVDRALRKHFDEIVVSIAPAPGIEADEPSGQIENPHR